MTILYRPVCLKQSRSLQESKATTSISYAGRSQRQEAILNSQRHPLQREPKVRFLCPTRPQFPYLSDKSYNSSEFDPWVYEILEWRRDWEFMNVVNIPLIRSSNK